MNNTRIDKSKYFSISFVLSRVLNSGVIMSIEKNESELKGLEKAIGKITKAGHVSLFNSYTGAVHAALWGQGIGHGDYVRIHDQASEQEKKFIRWLGLEWEHDHAAEPAYESVAVHWDNLKDMETISQSRLKNAPALVIDFTGLGFGPSAALAVNDEAIWKKGERLKIFGAFDLKTMWTQEESEPDIQPAAQFNYRLSPLVAACVKLSFLNRGREHEN